MTQGINATSTAAGMEMLAMAMAKTQQEQQGKIAMQLLQSAVLASPTTSTPAPVGNLGQSINVMV